MECALSGAISDRASRHRNKKHVKGRVNAARACIKAATGKVVGDKALERKGAAVNEEPSGSDTAGQVHRRLASSRRLSRYFSIPARFKL